MSKVWDKLTNRPALQKLVMDGSDLDCGVDISAQWVHDSFEEDVSAESRCRCGNFGLRYLWGVRNKMTGEILHPVGSECIKAFGDEEMVHITEVIVNLHEIRLLPRHEQFFDMLKRKELINRRVLEYVGEQGFNPRHASRLKKACNRRKPFSLKEIKRVEESTADLISWVGYKFRIGKGPFATASVR